MNKLAKSKAVAWIALVLCIIVLVLSMALPGIKNEWWQLIDIFFIFMMVFSHIAALYLEKMSKEASRTLDRFALIFGVLAVIAFFVVFILTGLAS